MHRELLIYILDSVAPGFSEMQTAKLVPRLRAYSTIKEIRLESDFTHQDGDIKALLDASMTFVPKTGFSVGSIVGGCRLLGWTAASNSLCSPFDLVEYFVTECTRKLASITETAEFETMKTSQKVRFLVWERLVMSAPLIDKWPEALALMSHPVNLQRSFNFTSELMDEIWYLAGDKSVDLNWYSKRLLLSGVYCSTELFMVGDKSNDFIHTKQFLDRRLRDVNQLGLGIAQSSQFVNFGMSQLKSIWESRINK